MNLKQLEVFKAVMATGSTSAASELMQLSQSAVSRQLAGLEAEIGLELFHRLKGRLVPTPEAQSLVREVDELAEAFARLKRRTEDLAAGTGSRTLMKLAAPHSMTTSVLPGVVRSFLADHPDLALEMIAGPYDAVERAVTGRAADFGFVRLPTEDRGFAVMPLVRSAMICALPARHPLAGRERLDFADVAACDQVMLGRFRESRRELEGRLKRARGKLVCRVETHSVASAIAFVAEGIGVAMVPALIGAFHRSDRVVFRPIDPPEWGDYGIVHLPDSPLSRPAVRLIALLRDRLLADAIETVGIAP